jgi:4-hydroxy-tetrahydrodipicolinate reductase
MTKVIITGSKGRMGQTLLACAARIPEIQVTGQIDEGDDLSKVIDKGDVVIDFSFHSVTASVAERCAKHKKGLVIGTTGHSEEEKKTISRFQAEIPMVWSSNYSTGVNTLFWLTRKAAEILGPGFDLEVVEMHHRLKKDAPSGTAVTLAEGIMHNMPAKEKWVNEASNSGNELSIISKRIDPAPGTHSIFYDSEIDSIEIKHTAHSRMGFAFGAVLAAEFIQDKKGIFNMKDVLG